MTGGPRVRTNVRVHAADGASLATDVYVPTIDRPVPAVVTRTPHGRISHLAEGLGWCARGIAFVAQDVRGRYDSDGRWAAYRNERRDGVALARWIVQQPWCDGRIIAAGGSYAAYTAWAMAVEPDCSVHGVISCVPAMGLDRVKFEPSGILRLAEHANWWLERADSRTSRDGLVAAMYRHEPGVLHHLPVCELPDRLWAELPGWSDVIAHGAVPSAEHVTDGELAQLTVPTLHVGGWYDLLATETLHQWIVAGAGTAPRPARTLILGPWGHDLTFTGTTRVGDRMHAANARIDLGALQTRWLRAVLGDGEPSPASAVYVVGQDEWMPVEEWPPNASGVECWFTGSGGELCRRPATAGTVEYTYDPRQPTPSTTPGADRRSLDARTDCARFTSGPLTTALHVIGTPEVELLAATSAASTDWIARVSERTAGGELFELARGSAVHPVSGAIRLTPIAARLAAGSRLELEITSSDFPFLARHLNTGADRYRTAATALARQRVATGPQGTRLLLPVQHAAAAEAAAS